MLIRFLDELSSSEEGAYLAGLQPATGVYGEHHYWAFMKHEPDTGLQMTLAFRQYLRNKYKSESLLQKAWDNLSVTFENAVVPDMEARINNTDGIFRNLHSERNLIDYYDCQHNLVADSVVHFCKITIIY